MKKVIIEPKYKVLPKEQALKIMFRAYAESSEDWNRIASEFNRDNTIYYIPTQEIGIRDTYGDTAENLLKK